MLAFYTSLLTYVQFSYRRTLLVSIVSTRVDGIYFNRIISSVGTCHFYPAKFLSDFGDAHSEVSVHNQVN